MSAQHTQGRLKVQHPYAGERGWEVAFEPGLEQVCQNVSEDNARRLVACWNAFEGEATERIEAGTSRNTAIAALRYLSERDELLSALKEARRWIGDGECADGIPREFWTPEYIKAVDGTDAAIAKAGGAA